MNTFSRYTCSAGGNVSIMLALSAVPLMFAGGLAVDYVRASQALTVLQAAADAAALAGGSSQATTDKDLESVAKKFLAANSSNDTVHSVKAIIIKNNKNTGEFSVRLKAQMKTTLMSLAGIESLDLDTTSEVMRGTAGPLEMVLALDTTYSMTENDKIGTLKTAAANLVNSVMSTENVKVGVAPFADYFKIGMMYKNEPWLKIPADKTESYKSCETVTYPDKSGCTIQSTCYADGVPYSCSYEQCTYWGSPVESNCTWSDHTYTWQGCIASRPEAYRDSIADIDVPYPGVTWDCGAPMQALTTKKADVIAAIDAMNPSGNTHIPSGLIWAWNMLTPEAPLTEAAPMADVIAQNGKKAVVLMTDGANSSSPYSDGNYGLHKDTSYGDSTYTDNLTSSLCSKIKGDGTIVYTVLFDVTDANVEKMLRNCASVPENSFVAKDAAELVAAFAKIGASLTQLRVTR
jgi:Flp pilus assembly protein TadG